MASAWLLKTVHGGKSQVISMCDVRKPTLQWPCTKPGPGKTSGILPITSHVTCHGHSAQSPRLAVAPWSSAGRQSQSSEMSKRGKVQGFFFLAELTTGLQAWFYPLERLCDAFVNRQSNAAAAQNSPSGWRIRTRPDLCILESRSGSSQGKKVLPIANLLQELTDQNIDMASKMVAGPGLNYPGLLPPTSSDLTSLWLY